MLVNKDYHF